MNNENAPADNSERPLRSAPMDEKSKWYEHHIEKIVPEDLNNFHLWMPHSAYIEQFNNHPRILDKPRTLDAHHLHSPKWAAQTLREFIQTIQNACEALHHKEGADVSGTELIELYKILRREGYSHYDLVA